MRDLFGVSAPPPRATEHKPTGCYQTPSWACEELIARYYGDLTSRRARRTAIRSFMGYGGNLTRPNRDQSPQRTGFRNYSSTTRRSIPAGDWRNWPEGLVQIIERLRGVIIEQRDARAVIKAHDAEHTLHYVDPPYVHATRGFDAGNTHRGYRHEMADDAHRELAETLRSVQGMVVLSGYACELYDLELYPNWSRTERRHMADGARKRTEVLWLNDACVKALRDANHQHPLFEVPA